MDVTLMRPEIAAAQRDALVVVSIAVRITVPLLEDLWNVSTVHRERYGDRAISLTLIKPNIAIPDDDARAHVKVINKRPGAAKFAIVVIDAGGFWAAAMRGIMASFSLVLAHAPLGAASVAEAVKLMGPKLGPGQDLVELERAIAGFRERHLALSTPEPTAKAKAAAR